MLTKSILNVLTVATLLPVFGLAQSKPEQMADLQKRMQQKPTVSKQDVGINFKNLAEQAKAETKKPITITNKDEILSKKQGTAGIDAGGSDGLEMQSKSTAKAGTVSVNIAELKVKTGFLRVDGESGENQGHQANISHCHVNSAGLLFQNGCKAIAALELNKNLKLPTGVYKVEYSNTYKWVNVLEGQTTRVPLIKIEVPSTGVQMQFWVVHDLTTKEMQRRYLYNFYASPAIEALIDKRDAYGLSPDLRRVAQQLQSSRNPWDLLHYFYFRDGKVGHMESAFKRDYAVVGDGPVRTFISVVPGIYGIIYETIETNQVGEKFGVIAE